MVSRVVRAEEGETFDLELSRDLLKANEELAEENKQLLKKHNIRAMDIMGSIGRHPS
jgi:hypothetical protein